MARTSCHVFDTATAKDLATFKLTNCKSLDKKTAVLMGLLYRNGVRDQFGIEGWSLHIMVEPAMVSSLEGRA